MGMCDLTHLFPTLFIWDSSFSKILLASVGEMFLGKSNVLHKAVMDSIPSIPIDPSSPEHRVRSNSSKALGVAPPKKEIKFLAGDMR